MNPLISLLSLAAAAIPLSAQADVSLNAGAVSDYRYRGISQTRLKPALQAGADWSDGGLYLGAWASTIRWIKDSGGNAPMEFDFYGGHKGKIASGLGYDIGVLRYQYPNARVAVSPNTTEIYGALTLGVFTAKYSHSTTNLFGFDHSRGSGYLDLSATLDLGEGMTLTPHVGRQMVRHNGAYSYTDFALTLSKDLNVVVLSATWLGTSSHAYTTSTGKNLGKGTLLVGAKFNF